MAPRINQPGNRTPAIIDKNQARWFEQMKQMGFIPERYTSLEELNSEVVDLAYRGLSDKEIADFTGIDYKNVIGKGLVKPEVSSTGVPRGVAMRSGREDIKPDEVAAMRGQYGDSFLEDVKRLRELEWGDKAPRKGEDVRALQSRIYDAMDGGRYSTSPNAPQFESSKVQADRARDRLHAAFGNGGRAAQVHRGHGVAALHGAGVSNRNLEVEWGPGNVGHGSDPRFDPDVLRNLNMSNGDLQALYDGYLADRGLDINPQRYSGNYVAADESLRELQRPEVTGRNNSIGNPQVTAPVEPGRVSQDSIGWRDRRMEELAQQRAVQLTKSGLDPEAALVQARAEMRDMSYQQSDLFDTTQSKGGPVRTSKPIPTERTVGTVVTPGYEQTDDFGRPKRPKPPSTRPATVLASPTNPQPIPRTSTKVKVTPTTTVVTPKPAAPPKPKPVPAVGKTPTRPASQPKVGQPAILNGQSVVWSGNGWVKVVTPKGIKAAKPAAKPTPKPIKAADKKPRGTAGVQLTDIAPPSTERYGPGGMFGTIDQLHERQFKWRQ